MPRHTRIGSSPVSTPSSEAAARRERGERDEEPEAHDANLASRDTVVEEKIAPVVRTRRSERNRASHSVTSLTERQLHQCRSREQITICSRRLVIQLDAASLWMYDGDVAATSRLAAASNNVADRSPPPKREQADERERCGRRRGAATLVHAVLVVLLPRDLTLPAVVPLGHVRRGRRTILVGGAATTVACGVGNGAASQVHSSGNDEGPGPSDAQSLSVSHLPCSSPSPPPSSPRSPAATSRPRQVTTSAIRESATPVTLNATPHAPWRT